jgi:hypothetical protein
MYINNADNPRRGVTLNEPHPVLFGLKVGRIGNKSALGMNV